MSMQVTMVPSEHAAIIWPQVLPHLKKTVEYTYGRYEADDMLTGIVDYGDTLWVAFNDTGIKGAVVTSFSIYPRKKYVNMVFCGGERMDEWKAPMLKMLQHWAYDNDCDGVECSGRLGWTKIFKDDGFKFLWQTFELPAADTGLEVNHG